MLKSESLQLGGLPFVHKTLTDEDGTDPELGNLEYIIIFDDLFSKNILLNQHNPAAAWETFD